MPVIVDQQNLAAEQMGMQTVGQVLSHVQKDRRLIVHVLIDGQEPDLDQLPAVKQSPLAGHTVFIETADPRQIANEALEEVQKQLSVADQLKGEAVELLQSNQPAKAMEKLGECFNIWQNAQDSVLKTGQLLGMSLDNIAADGMTIPAMLQQFTAQLRQIKTALENRDFVLLGDILTYETTQTSARWRSAIESLRQIISAR